MTSDELKRTQQRLKEKGFYNGAIDGLWGSLSEAAVRNYLRSIMPLRRFPTRTEIATNNSIFGRHGIKDSYTPPTRTITLPFTIFYEGRPVNVLRPHEKAADAFLGAFLRLAAAYPTDAERKEAGILDYNGLYNPRPMRGSTTAWSMHAWAIAIDFNQARNKLTMHWPKVASMPLLVIECFMAEGLWSLGGMEARDAMHFEATSGR